jgi:hypothetical protein
VRTGWMNARMHGLLHLHVVAVVVVVVHGWVVTRERHGCLALCDFSITHTADLEVSPCGGCSNGSSVVACLEVGNRGFI